ncbi:hypothetical protein [Actinomadura hibisca]|uniref:hypothetical protein n=1 Tax=Actinomadura hibisca TaxID=68565 RepID=UPI0008364296|nr:hypothetical protein [Actinomadura hibisca]
MSIRNTRPRERDATADDALMALSLITVWSMRTGRSLRPVPVSELTAQELEDFWADDQMVAPDGASGVSRP